MYRQFRTLEKYTENERRRMMMINLDEREREDDDQSRRVPEKDENSKFQKRQKRHLLRTSPTPFDLNSYNSVVAQNGKISIRHNENIFGSSLSPRYFLWHNIMGNSARSGSLKCDLQRHVVEKRMKYLRISWRHQIPFASSLTSGVHSMDVDPVDNRYLLCGGARGEISIVDLERPFSTDSWSRVEHTVTPCGVAWSVHFMEMALKSYFDNFFLDTSTFISSDRDGKVKAGFYFRILWLTFLGIKIYEVDLQSFFADSL
ncbi:unnamed protein product [Onchocerca flexuosa]|uniref:Kelch repeat protein n=1 Tax=Onchocerca flexuosa TaxID=387005 RepID=A0A183I1N4_9BILA|nr:unnamed protein product [Onchocerca flexuosa]